MENLSQNLIPSISFTDCWEMEITFSEDPKELIIESAIAYVFYNQKFYTLDTVHFIIKDWALLILEEYFQDGRWKELPPQDVEDLFDICKLSFNGRDELTIEGFGYQKGWLRLRAYNTKIECLFTTMSPLALPR